MKKTISQIAKEQNVSTQAIYQRIKRLQSIDNEFARHVNKDENKRTVIDEEGQQILFANIGNMNEEDLQDITNEYITSLHEQIALLASQLQIKDQQIETLQNLVLQAHTLAQTEQLTEKKKSIFHRCSIGSKKKNFSLLLFVFCLLIWYILCIVFSYKSQ